MSIVIQLYKNYVKGTAKKSIVQLVQVHICHLTNSVIKGLQIPCNKVYLSTRVLKHVYDKRPAEEFDFMMENISNIVKYPNKIYRNKNGKRGSYCFVKQVQNLNCLVSIEAIKNNEENMTHCEIATFFRVDDDYLLNYELLWEWKGGTPSS